MLIICSGNRWYDQAFSEMVCESLDFNSDVWYCVMGGAQQIAYKMRDKINKQQPSRITYKKVVKYIGYMDSLGSNGECLRTGFQDGSEKYYHAGKFWGRE